MRREGEKAEEVDVICVFSSLPLSSLLTPTLLLFRKYPGQESNLDFRVRNTT